MEALCESTFYVVSNARVRVCARVSLLRRQLYSVPYSTMGMLMRGAWYTHGQHVDLAGRVWWMAGEYFVSVFRPGATALRGQYVSSTIIESTVTCESKFRVGHFTGLCVSPQSGGPATTRRAP